MNIVSKKIGLLGGSFDPPHKGHLYISKDALKSFKLDYVWWIVVKQNTFKKHMASDFNHRIELCKEFLKKEPQITVLDIEKNIRSNDTIDILNWVIPRHCAPTAGLPCFARNNEYFWIMGSDVFHSFDQWPKWQEILQLVKLIVYNRTNFEFKEKKINPILKKCQTNLEKFQHSTSPRWVLVKTKTPNISSTELRHSTKNAKI